MAANKLIFKDAEAARDAITESQKKEIAQLYSNWANDLSKMALYYSHKTTSSAPLSERYYKELYAAMKETSKSVSEEIESKIKANLYLVSDAVVRDNVKWLESLGFKSEGVNASFSYIPDNIVRNLVTGQIYESGWSLSKAIWTDNDKTLKDIYAIVAKGVAENTPIYNISKELEAYVNPERRLPWNLTMGDGARIYKKQVDYNAQRLARTLVQHGYQQSFMATTKNNPFVTEYEWSANGSRVCQICMDRDGKHFKKDELPMDHPNGMCSMIPVIVDDLEQRLADWVNSPDGTYPDIDAFAKNFGYQPNAINTVQDFISKYGTSTKTPQAWFNGLSPEAKAQAKTLKLQSGLKWDDWYKQNIYVGDGTNLEKGKKVKAFSDIQEKYLTPYGFSVNKMPSTFSEWSHALSDSQAIEILKSMGTDFNDLHPYQKLLEYYNKNLTDKNFVMKKETIPNKTKEEKPKQANTMLLTSQFDKQQWVSSLSKNDLREMERWCYDWLKIISSNEKKGVNIYTSSAYSDMNKFLRGQATSTSYQTEINNATRALKKAKLPKETIVRRGAGYSFLKQTGVDLTEDNKNKIIGAVLEELGFMSTSPDPTGGFGGSVEYIIKVPEGSQAMYVAPVSDYEHENELLINRGGKYIVDDVEFGKDGAPNKVYMTLINLK